MGGSARAWLGWGRKLIGEYGLKMGGGGRGEPNCQDAICYSNPNRRRGRGRGRFEIFHLRISEHLGST